jgi:hypothetical protein
MTTLIPIGATLISVVGLAEKGVPAQVTVFAIVLFSTALTLSLLSFAVLFGHLGPVPFFLLGSGPSGLEELGIISADRFLLWTTRQSKPN